MEWFLFKAGSEFFGIEADSVYRIIEDTQVSAVPLTPACYVGLIYYRGELFEVIDIAHLYDCGRIETGKAPRIILVKSSDRKFGLVSDVIIGIHWTEGDQVDDNLLLHEQQSIKMMSPNDIWDKLQNLTYGPV